MFASSKYILASLFDAMGFGCSVYMQHLLYVPCSFYPRVGVRLAFSRRE